MGKLLGRYVNGGYAVYMFSDGTKVRYGDGRAVFPESIDLCVTHRCDGGCPFCYDDAGLSGRHAELVSYGENGFSFAQEWMEGLKPYTELALNGNDLTHPELEDFLGLCKERKVICNLTVNARHFAANADMLKSWQRRGLIHGIGVSVGEKPLDVSETGRLTSLMEGMENIVFHVICGTPASLDIESLSRLCSGVSGSVLFLGYKKMGRGRMFARREDNGVWGRICELKSRVGKIIDDVGQGRSGISAVSFDCLGYSQLGLSRIVRQRPSLSECYMGDDGTFTMYVDAVERKFSVSSTDMEVRFDIGDKGVEEMFSVVREYRGVYHEIFF